MTEETIFHEALARAREARSAFLDQACAGNPTLRASVEELLRASVGARQFMETVGGAEPLALDRPGDIIGP